ncbi:myo-inositol transporter itr1 [Cryptotrichosporon argae]
MSGLDRHRYSPVASALTPRTARSRDGEDAIKASSIGDEDMAFETRAYGATDRHTLLDGALSSGEVDEGEVVVDGEDQATTFVWILVCTASISGLLFGYDTGVISGTLISIRSDLGHALSSREMELVTSSTTFGALLGGLGAGALSDVVGRKPVLALANVVFVAGAAGQAVSHTVAAMTAGRFVVGLAVGLASCVAPLYIGELAPTKLRGRLVTINIVAVTLGQVIAYAIGAIFEQRPGGWRYMVGLGAVPAVLQLCAFSVLPESPRILLVRARRAEATSVLARIYPRAARADIDRKADVMDRAVRQAVALEQTTTWAQRAAGLVRVGSNRRALIIGCALMALQQLSGFNTLMYYSATLFAMLGFRNATATGLLIALVNFGATLVALRVVDPVGRRRVMLYSVPGMVGALLAAAVAFYALTRETGGVLVDGHAYARAPASLVLAAMLAFVAAYAVGCGNIPWQQGELFRLEVRGIATGVCTAVCWSANLLVGATFLSLLAHATPAGAFGLYALVAALGWVFVYACYPETSGLSLEQVCGLFEHGWGVEEGAAIWAKRARGAQNESASAG